MSERHDARNDTQQRHLYDQASRLVGFGGWECDLTTEGLTWTDSVFDIFELPLGTVPKRAAILGLYHDESRAHLEKLRSEALRTGHGFVLDARIRTYRGSDRWIRVTLEVVRDAGRSIRTFGAKQNITSQQEAWARLRHLAERDPLTGLANRGLFEERYRAAMSDEINGGYVSALALVDVDRFKAINDCYGHAAGDECLRQVALRLDRIFSGASLVARIGGDEFAVLLADRLPHARLAARLEKAARLLSKPFAWNGQSIDLSVSIGARIVSRPLLRRRDGLFSEADEALYAAKAAGRNTVRIFGADLPVERDIDTAAASWRAIA